MSSFQWLPSAEDIALVLAELGFVATAQSLTVSGGAAFAKGEVGYIHTDGTVRKGINSSTIEAASVECMCIETAGVADGAAGFFLCCPGIVAGLTDGTAGAVGFVDGTAGAITTTVPSGSAWIKPIGRWLSATVFKFDAPTALAPYNFG